MALDNFRAAPLPNPPAQWDPQYMRQVLRVLELYFGQLDSRTPNNAQQYSADRFIGGSLTGTNVTAASVATDALLFGSGAGTFLDVLSLASMGHRNLYQTSNAVMADDFYGGSFYGGGRHITTPYNQFTSATDQTAANNYTAYEVTYDTSDFPDGITLSNSSRLNVAHEGIYLFTYSIQLKNTTNDVQDVDFWFRKGGSDIAASNSRFSLPPRKGNNDPSHLIAVTPFMVDLAANDYVELVWKTTDVGASIEHFAAVTASPGVTPAIPATPSVIMTAQFVSAQFPPVTRVAPLPVFGFGQIGNISVVTR
jgi:hypothetical protein